MDDESVKVGCCFGCIGLVIVFSLLSSIGVPVLLMPDLIWYFLEKLYKLF